MDLSFVTAELREICEKRAVASDKLGYAAARELSDRLADIEAVDTVAELAGLLGASLYDRSPTEKVLRLTSGFEVIFMPGHPAGNPTPEAPDWEMTTRMKVTAIEPVHG